MGEVYRARDTRLKREVAIKVLPEAFSQDPERLARLQREAELLATLNHPNIGAIHGLEDADGVTALVLELVEGPTLADRIAQGPVPLDETLPIAKQIAEALEAAHELGMIHRDLKPANIKVRGDGTVKVLDFGLAKLTESGGLGRAGELNASQSPTITSPAQMTGVGVILGTAAYMSPEQAKGQEADKRSDIWAFGCVLYEMLTGRRAFDGDDMTEVLGAVVRLEPNWQALPSDLPQAIRTLLQRCLVKDRRKRIADIAAALFVLDHQAGVAPTSTESAALLLRRLLWQRVAALTAGALVVAVLTGALVWLATRQAPPRVVRTTIVTSGTAALTQGNLDRDIAITPDGSSVVYRGNNQLLVRALDQLEPTVLGGLGAPHGVFISPDGQWIGFFDGNRTLKKVPIRGGPPTPVCAVAQPRGGSWSEDGTIVFATNAPETGLQRVSDSGGEPEILTKPDRQLGEGDHLWPEFLPGGQAVLFTITPVGGGGTEDSQIAVLDLRTRKSKPLAISGSHAQYITTGHLVYGVAGTLRAVAFDLERLEVVGPPAPVLEGVVTKSNGAADVAVAANGSLLYVPATGGAGLRTVVSVDREGRATPLPGLPPDSYRDVQVSPNGSHLALATQGDVFTYDFEREIRSRLTTDPASDNSPLWTPDSKRIIFTSNRMGYPELFSRSADGNGTDVRLLTRARDLVGLRATGWSEAGQLLFYEVSPSRPFCVIGQIAIEPQSDAKALMKSELGCNNYATVSPDGRWIAYDSDESGQYEVRAERYPELGGRTPISSGGGRLSNWSRDSPELFFASLDGRQMFTVAVQSGTFGRPKVLFEYAMVPPNGNARSYDIGPKGQFFIIRNAEAETAGGTASNLILVQNWFEELKRLVPTK